MTRPTEEVFERELRRFGLMEEYEKLLRDDNWDAVEIMLERLNQIKGERMPSLDNSEPWIRFIKEVNERNIDLGKAEFIDKYHEWMDEDDIGKEEFLEALAISRPKKKKGKLGQMDDVLEREIGKLMNEVDEALEER